MEKSFKRKIWLLLFVMIVGTIAIFTGSSENDSLKKELANLPLSVGGNAFSGIEYELEDFLVTSDSYVEINGVKVDADRTTPVNIGDVLEIHLEWSLPNTTTFTTNDTFVLEFPEARTLNNNTNG